ncbi:MAG: hypothetical protein EA398_16690 [Deltaproteobacteria bacterium]|nr:MAG: hypothetical protein EA398_16690 [Deltaproteobacteria bacterium]
MAKLDKDAMTWIIVGIVGYVLAFVWITGPLGWWQGNRICREFQAMGLEPSGSAKAAKWIGIIGTALFVLGMLAVIGVVMMMFVLGGAALAL